MGPLVAGIVILLLVFLIPLPYAVHVIGLVLGFLAVVYGIWILFAGRGPRARL